MFGAKLYKSLNNYFSHTFQCSFFLIVTFIVTILDPGTILGKVQLIEDGATGPL